MHYVIAAVFPGNIDKRHGHIYGVSGKKIRCKQLI